MCYDFRRVLYSMYPKTAGVIYYVVVYCAMFPTSSLSVKRFDSTQETHLFHPVHGQADTALRDHGAVVAETTVVLWVTISRSVFTVNKALWSRQTGRHAEHNRVQAPAKWLAQLTRMALCECGMTLWCWANRRREVPAQADSPYQHRAQQCKHSCCRHGWTLENTARHLHPVTFNSNENKTIWEETEAVRHTTCVTAPWRPWRAEAR